ncbi:MAG: TolC family protein [candidate division Zixibacteria bacterium]|nr:TolC family protein [candidate division Zixibacteria bacterium]
MNCRQNLTILLINSLFIFLQCTILNAETLTLNKALDRAFNHNREYLTAVKELEKANSRITEARAGALPVISASGGYVRNWEPSVFVISTDGEPQELKIGTDNSFRAGFNLTQPIYLGGKLGTALRIAKIYKKYSEQSLVTVFNKTRFEVYQRYYDYVYAQDLVRVAEQSNNQAKASREDVEKMFSRGLISEYDLLRAKVAEANAVPSLIKARSAASTAGDALKSTLGMDLSEQINPIAEYDFEGVDSMLSQPVDYYRNMALNKRSDVKGMQYQIEMLDKNISIEKASYFPSLVFSSDLYWEANRDDWNLDPDNWSRSISSSLMLSIPIFEGFGRSAKVKQAKIDKQQADLNYLQLQDAAELDVNVSYGDVKEAYERLNSQKQTVEMAAEGLRIAELRYQNGVGTQLEIIDSRTALVAAETNLASAKHDLILSYAKFEKAIGIIKPE